MLKECGRSVLGKPEGEGQNDEVHKSIVNVNIGLNIDRFSKYTACYGKILLGYTAKVIFQINLLYPSLLFYFAKKLK